MIYYDIYTIHFCKENIFSFLGGKITQILICSVLDGDIML